MKLTKAIAQPSCAECQDALEFYVDAELRDKNARAQFPTIAQHLRTCATCRAAYRLLHDAVRATTAPPATPRKLPFLTPARADTPWTTQVRGRIAGARLGVRFELPADLLRGLFAMPTYAVLRGADEPERALLLADTLRIGDADVAVELWLKKNGTTQSGAIEVSAVSNVPLPQPLRVTIRWKGFRYSRTLKQGMATIEKINVATLQSAPALRVDFETGAQGATIEEYRGIG